MTARKHKTYKNTLYVLDRKGNLYIDPYGRVKRSKDIFYYELTINTGSGWRTISDKFNDRATAINKLNELAI